MSTFLQELHKVLDADPSDQVTRSVLADYLEEQGKDATALRWIVTNNRYPCSRLGIMDYGDRRGVWCWIGGPRTDFCNPDTIGKYKYSFIPYVIWKMLDLYLQDHEPGVWKSYLTRQGAEEALARAIVGVKL